MSASLTSVKRILLPRRVVDITQSHLADVGSEGLEGMALWAGKLAGDEFYVTDAFIPQQQGISTPHGLLVSVSGEELHRMNMYLYRKGIRLLAQIHSHPTHAYHSSTDDEHAIATALGSFSLVVPDFAAQPFSLDACAIYRLTERKWYSIGNRPTWNRVDLNSVNSLFKIVD